MSKFMRNITVTSEFDGDTVKASFRPISTPAAFELKRGGDGPDTENAMLRIAKDHITQISGLKAADGTAISMDELFDSAYFLPLILDLSASWISQSMPSGNSQRSA